MFLSDLKAFKIVLLKDMEIILFFNQDIISRHFNEYLSLHHGLILCFKIVTDFAIDSMRLEVFVAISGLSCINHHKKNKVAFTSQSTFASSLHFTIEVHFFLSKCNFMVPKGRKWQPERSFRLCFISAP